MIDIILLKILEEKNLHVHNITAEESLPMIPLASQGIATHYIMHKADIVYCGSIQGIKLFASSFDPNNYKVSV